MENKNPLVSICIPVFNGGDLIFRALTSCVNQTYKNIEIVISNNASTDNTREIILQFAAKDKRIKYFKNDTNIGPPANFLKVLELATGNLIQILGHDDWLSKNYIEEGIKNFNIYPDTAAVFLKNIGFKTNERGALNFDDDLVLKRKIYLREYFIKNMYKSQIAGPSIYSIMRTKDAIAALKFTLDIFNNPPKNLPESFRVLCKRGFGIDIIFFLKLFMDYKYVVFTDKAAYVKIEHANNYSNLANENMDMDNAAGIFFNLDFFRVCHEFMFLNELKEYLFGLRVFIAADLFNTLLISYIKSHFKKAYFKGFRCTNVTFFFRDYSFWQIFCSIIHTPIRFLIRTTIYIVKKKQSNKKYSGDDSLFLNESLQFISPTTPLRYE